MFRSSRMIYFNPLLAIAVTLIACYTSTPTFGQGDEACLMSSSVCQCAPTTPSGTCTRSNGDGTCLLGECQSGFRCDCFGFEVCNKSKCGKYVPSGNEQPSMSVPFRCDLKEELRECTTLKDVLDSGTASRHAEASASTTNDEITSIGISVTTILEEMQTDKQVLNQLLRDLDVMADDVPLADLELINEGATKVGDAVAEATDVVHDVSALVVKGGAAVNEVRGLMLEAVTKDREITGKRAEHDAADETAHNGKKSCTACADLLAQIEALIELRKAAARQCGLKAQDARELLKSAQDKVKEVRRVQARAVEVFKPLNNKLTASLAKVDWRLEPGTAV